MIKDSGNRTEFKSGAVRDIQEGKGRCDLLPLDIIDLWCNDGLQGTLYYVGEYLKSKGSNGYVGIILDQFAAEHQVKDFESGENSKHSKIIPLDQYKWELVLEVAKHFEEGAKKYGDRNWEKGIPCDRYIDSAVRHYCKWRAGWTDEPHDRAFIWNILCCEWTRQQYGWNLERLEKEGDFRTQCLNRPYFRSVDANEKFVDITKLSPEELHDRYFSRSVDVDKSESKEGVKIGKQLSKGIQDGLKLVSSLNGEEAAKKVHWGYSQLTETESVSEQCGVYDDIRLNDDTEITIPIGEPVNSNELFKILDIDENAGIKEVLETMQKMLKCREMWRENFRKCLDTACSECEYNHEPSAEYDCLQTLIDYVEKSLKEQEVRHNRYVKDTDEGWHFYDPDGRLIGYIFKFKEPEEGRKHQLSKVIHKVWHEATGNPYTIKRIVEEWGYICGKDFSICIAPDIVAKEYDLRNRKYNEED